jgi:hypothetical protein
MAGLVGLVGLVELVGCSSSSSPRSDGRVIADISALTDVGAELGVVADLLRLDTALDAARDAVRETSADATPGPTPTFTVMLVDNAEGDFASRGYLAAGSLFRRNVQVAADRWAAEFRSAHTVKITVRPDRSLPRGGGTFTVGALYKTIAGRKVYEPGPLTRLRTGNNPGDVAGKGDIILSFNLQFTDQHYWLDPSPGSGAATPAGKTDWISIVLHELGHGLGIAGRRSFAQANYGALPPTLMSRFDALTSFVGGQATLSGQPNRLLFNGATATKLYGSAVPLASYDFNAYLFSQNFYHLADYADDPTSPSYWKTSCAAPSIDADALMTSCPVPVAGSHLVITAIDRAILQDLGYTLTRPLPR